MPTIYLAADSTVQSYPQEQYPQTGWGQVFYKFFKEKSDCKPFVREDAPGQHVVTYRMPTVSIENHAFAARSSRSFIEQGRLEDIMKVAKAGDVLMVQFAHNDAYKAKEERYVPVEDFGTWLMKYKKACDEKGMLCIFVTPVSMRVFDADGKCGIAFSEYRDKMIETAKENGVFCVDLSLLSTRLFEKTGPADTRDIFLWVFPGEYPDSNFMDGANDNAHFQEYGATLMAGLVAKAIKEDTLHSEFDFLKEAITDDFSVDKPVRNYPEGFAWEEEGDMLKAAGKEILNRN